MENLNQILILSGLWIGWCALHSLLITPRITTAMEALLKDKFAYYRLSFNILSAVTLVPLLFYHMSIQETVLFGWPRFGVLLKLAMYLAAFMMFYGGYRIYDLQHVLGLKQIRELTAAEKSAPMPFKTSGILEYVRHPWYTGGILLVWSFGNITDVSLAIKMILSVYFVIGTVLEERKLVAEIGEPYKKYCQRVPMLIPWKKIL